MATTRLIEKPVTGTNLRNEAGGIPSPLANDLVKTILNMGKPATAWEITARLGDDCAEQAEAILNELAAQGILIRFRAGLNNYYATPKVALTEEEPALRAVMSDSLKSLLLIWRYKVLGKPGRTDTYYRSE